MRRFPVAAAALALALAGCPLPQPLPDYPAGTITPPRILAASTSSSTVSGVQSIAPVPAGCATPPSYELDARIFYQDSVTVEARWFVDYRSDVPSRYTPRNTVREVPPDPNALVLERQVPAFTFQPYGFDSPEELGVAFTSRKDPGIVHVVELVVSNGFDTTDIPNQAQPNRMPGSTPDGQSKFEIQSYRWTFVNVPESTGCNAGDPGCVKCP